MIAEKFGVAVSRGPNSEQCLHVYFDAQLKLNSRGLASGEIVSDEMPEILEDRVNLWSALALILTPIKNAQTARTQGHRQLQSSLKREPYSYAMYPGIWWAPKLPLETSRQLMGQ